MQSVQALQGKKLNLLHDVLSCIGEQGTEALVRYINENSVENHHHYNGRSLPYSKVFIAWKSAEFLNESWQAPIDQFLVTHDSLQTSTLSQIPAMLSCCHKYARKPENSDTQQKLPPQIEDFSLFNSRAIHTICRPSCKHREAWDRTASSWCMPWQNLYALIKQWQGDSNSHLLE